MSSFETLFVNGVCVCVCVGGGGGGGGVGCQGREVVERILYCGESGASQNTPLLSLFS